MQRFLQRHWPALAAIGILWIAIAVQIYLAVARNDGHFIYTFDDAYIHLAIAKNFGEYGIWGVTKYGFTSSASSLIWPILVAMATPFPALFGWAPLVLNIVCATAILWMAYGTLRRYGVHPAVSFGVLLVMMLIMPLYAMTLTGMEHLLHTLLMVAILPVAAAVLSERTNRSSIPPALLPLLSLLLVMTRYEGMFTVGLIALLLGLQRRWIYAGVVVVAGMMPVIVYGLISTGNGWFFLPNSVLLKGTSPELSSLSGLLHWLGTVVEKILEGKDVLLFMLAGILLLVVQYRRHRTLWRPVDIMLLLFVGSAFLHKVSAAYGFRYTAYLMAAGSLTVAASLHDYLRATSIPVHRRSIIYGTLAVVLCVVALPALNRGILWTLWMPQASGNIYQQQYQMGRFVQRYYNDRTVAANDIGLLCYQGNARIVDLAGLANIDIARLKHAQKLTTAEIASVCRQSGATLAMVYDSWFTENGGLPPQWQKVGEWQILNNRICGGDIVSIYAIDPAEHRSLLEHLREFSQELPGGVIQTGVYTRDISER